MSVSASLLLRAAASLARHRAWCLRVPSTHNCAEMAAPRRVALGAAHTAPPDAAGGDAQLGHGWLVRRSCRSGARFYCVPYTQAPPRRASAKPKITIDPSPKQKRSMSQIKRPEKSKFTFYIKAKLFRQEKLKTWD